MEQTVKNKIIIFLVAGILVAFGFAIFSKGSAPTIFPLGFKVSFQPELGLKGCRPVELDLNNPNKYNAVSSLEFVQIKPADDTLLIGKDQQKRMFSLGKFKLPLETYTILNISKLWLYFSSDVLSDRDDKLYGLEDSYLSRIILNVEKQSQEISLGKTGEHTFLELDDCPFGPIYPLNYETEMNFEILLEIGCNNFKDGACLDNSGKLLDYINGADLTASIRFFATSQENFTKDISVPLHFKYE